VVYLLVFWSDFLHQCFQPGFRGISLFREWLPGVPLKRTEIAWDKIRNHSSMPL